MKKKIDKGWSYFYREWMKSLAGNKGLSRKSRMIWVIIYYTIGFKRKVERIPYKEFEELTGIDRRNQDVLINALVEKGVIWKKDRFFGLCTVLKKKELSSVLMTKELSSDKKTFVINYKKNVITSEHFVISSDKVLRSSLKNLSKEPLKRGKKEREIFKKFKEKDLEKNRKKALDMVEGLKKKFDKKGL